MGVERVLVGSLLVAEEALAATLLGAARFLGLGAAVAAVLYLCYQYAKPEEASK